MLFPMLKYLESGWNDQKVMLPCSLSKNLEGHPSRRLLFFIPWLPISEKTRLKVSYMLYESVGRILSFMINQPSYTPWKLTATALENRPIPTGNVIDSNHWFSVAFLAVSFQGECSIMSSRWWFQSFRQTHVLGLHGFKPIGCHLIGFVPEFHETFLVFQIPYEYPPWN